MNKNTKLNQQINDLFSSILFLFILGFLFFFNPSLLIHVIIFFTIYISIKSIIEMLSNSFTSIIEQVSTNFHHEENENEAELFIDFIVTKDSDGKIFIHEKNDKSTMTMTTNNDNDVEKKEKDEDIKEDVETDDHDDDNNEENIKKVNENDLLSMIEQLQNEIKEIKKNKENEEIDEEYVKFEDSN